MRILKSQQGLTLVELMIVLFTAGLLLVTAIGLMLNVTGTSSNFVQSLDTEIEELGAANALQLVFAQATEVKFNPSLTNTYSNANGRGAVREYDSNDDFGTRDVSTLAVFTRDRQVSRAGAPGALTSDLVSTALFFQPPTANTFGVLYFALGNGPLAPTRDQLHFDGLVRVRIRNMTTYSPTGASPTSGDPVTSFDMELTFRRFMGAIPPDRRMFCPQAHLDACPGIGAFHDVARLFKVNLRNNVLAESPNSPNAAGTVLGGRMYDLVQFFSLNVPGEIR